jgi:hypothetical protein
MPLAENIILSVFPNDYDGCVAEVGRWWKSFCHGPYNNECRTTILWSVFTRVGPDRRVSKSQIICLGARCEDASQGTQKGKFYALDVTLAFIDIGQQSESTEKPILDRRLIRVLSLQRACS